MKTGLSAFYTFVGEDDLLSANPLAAPLSARAAAKALKRLNGAPASERLAVFLRAGRWTDAEALAKAARDPGLLAVTLWVRGDRERTKAFVPRALAAAEAAVRRGDRSRDALLLRAQIRFELDDHAGALSDIDAVLRADPKDDMTRVGKVDKLLDMGLYARAHRELKVLSRRHGRKWWWFAQRGRVRAFDGDARGALADFDRALRLRPDSGALHAWKAEVLRREGRLAAAARLLERAKRLDPRHALAWEHAGRLKLVRGDLRGAWRDLDRACRLDPLRYLAFAWRGEAAFKLRRWDAAWADFESVAPLEPRSTWNAPGDRAAAFWRDMDAAAATGAPGALLLRGRFRASNGDPRGAVEDLSVAISRGTRLQRRRALPLRADLLEAAGAITRAQADRRAVRR